MTGRHGPPLGMIGGLFGLLAGSEPLWGGQWLDFVHGPVGLWWKLALLIATGLITPTVLAASRPHAVWPFPVRLVLGYVLGGLGGMIVDVASFQIFRTHGIQHPISFVLYFGETTWFSVMLVYICIALVSAMIVHVAGIGRERG